MVSKSKKPTVKQKSDEDNYDFMKTNKDNIKNIIRDHETLKIINNLAIKTNKIVIHAYNFIKLYCIHLFENNLDFPEFDKEYIMDVFKAITTRKCGSGGYTKDNMPQQLKELTEFFEKHYKDTMVPNEELLYDKMSYILAYEAIDMTTNIYISLGCITKGFKEMEKHFGRHFSNFLSFKTSIPYQPISSSKID